MVIYEVDGRVAVLRINRPEARNAVNGEVAAGMEADLVDTGGNPLDDITTVRNPIFVMKGGNVFRNIPGAARP